MKGEYNGECNRTACNGGPAIWFNSATERYYCTRCARKINAVNGEICKLVRK